MSGDQLIHLLVEIALAGDEFADNEELNLRSQLVKLIESRGIGHVGGFGSGQGGMDVSALARSEQLGREQLAALVRELAPTASFTIEVMPDEDDA